MKTGFPAGSRLRLHRATAHLDPRDRSTLACALRVAAEQYRQDAASCAESPRLREEFLAQASEAETFLRVLLEDT